MQSFCSASARSPNAQECQQPSINTSSPSLTFTEPSPLQIPRIQTSMPMLIHRLIPLKFKHVQLQTLAYLRKMSSPSRLDPQMRARSRPNNLGWRSANAPLHLATGPSSSYRRPSSSIPRTAGRLQLNPLLGNSVDPSPAACPSSFRERLLASLPWLRSGRRKRAKGATEGNPFCPFKL